MSLSKHSRHIRNFLHRLKHWCRKSPLPRKSGRHVQQDAPPLLPLMELPDPRRSVSASTHKPDGDNRHSHSVHRPTDVKVAATRSWLWINEMFLLHLSPEWQNWMLSTLSCVEGSVLVGDYGSCNVLNQTHGISLFSPEEILTVWSWSSDIFSGVPLPK